MKEIKQNKNVKIAIPLDKALEQGTLLSMGSFRLLVENAPNYNAITDSETKVKVTEINHIEEVFVAELLSHYGEDGYELSWNSVINSPYIEILKDSEIPEDLVVYKDAVWENDTHKLIRIYGSTYNDGHNTTPCTFEVLKNWVDAFDVTDIISTPSLVTAKLKEYITEE